MNGEPQGTAFEDIWAEVYYPAASLFKAASVTFNFGPTFDFPPADCDARPVCELAKPSAAASAADTAAAAAAAAAPPAEVAASAPCAAAPELVVAGSVGATAELMEMR